MPVKRQADPGFIKPDPDKRVKREGGDGNFNLSSIPMAPTHATTASSNYSIAAPKSEIGNRKPLAPAPNFGGGNPVNMRKKKFFGNSIKARRGDDLVSAHFDRKTMTVEFSVQCARPKKWSSAEVEQEIFERLNKAKFEIQPLEHWGFLDRHFPANISFLSHAQPCTFNYVCGVCFYSPTREKVENSSSYFKKEERTPYPKNERLE